MVDDELAYIIGFNVVLFDETIGNSRVEFCYIHSFEVVLFI